MRCISSLSKKIGKSTILDTEMSIVIDNNQYWRQWYEDIMTNHPKYLKKLHRYFGIKLL